MQISQLNAFLEFGVGELTWPLLRTFHDARPDLDLTVVRVGFDNALPLLHSGVCNVLLAVGPFGTATACVATVGWTPLNAILPVDHPLGDAPQVSVSELAARITVQSPEAMGPDWGDFWAMRSHGGHPRRSPVSILEVPELIPAVVNRRFVGLWPTAAGGSPNVVLKPLDPPIAAPLQLVGPNEPSADVDLFLDIGRRLAQVGNRGLGVD